MEFKRKRLFSPELYPMIMQTSRISDAQLSVQVFSIMRKLDPEVLPIVKRVAMLFRKVIEHADKNKMSCKYEGGI